MSYKNIDDEAAIALANALTSNTKLKHLDLSISRRVSNHGWRTFFNLLQNSSNSALERFDLEGNNIDDEAVHSLASTLAIMSSLKVLLLPDNRQITAAGWRTFFGELWNSNSALERLYLYDNSIGDEAVDSMMVALANMSSLKELNLSSNRLVTPSGWRLFSNLLRHPNSGLEKLYVYDNGSNINDDVVIAFANALVNNTRLNTFEFNINSVAARGWNALSNVLCNKQN